MHLRLLSLASLLLLAGPALRAAEKVHTPIEEQMEEINAAYRKLGRQVSDPAKNADSLKQVAIIRTHALAAMKHDPIRKADVPAPEQAKFVSEYQAAMKAFVAKVDRLGEALQAGKNEIAAAVLKELKTAQEEGHRDFRRRKLTFQEKAAEAARRNEEK
jgi:soluble cytochrome b562